MDTSIQIQTVVYKNDTPSLTKALDSIQNAIRVFRSSGESCNLVVLYGDASPEPVWSVEEVESLCCRYSADFMFKYMFFNENTGTSRGHNIMFRSCESDYIVVQNPDICYSPWFFQRMLEPFMSGDERVALTEARQVPIEHHKSYDPDTFETSWSTGACVMLRSDVYRQVGGFDEASFFMYCDDVDLSWRIRLAGYVLKYQPLAPVFHAKHLDLGGCWVTTDAERYYSAVANLLMAHKWSYPDICATALRGMQESADPVQRRAAEEFEARKREGRLPNPLDPNHTVADVRETGYATSRYLPR